MCGDRGGLERAGAACPTCGYRRVVPPANRHRPIRSWTLALLYFVACWLVAFAVGTTEMLGDPFGDRAGEPWFWLLGFAALATAGVGYWVVWPMGTHTSDRVPRPVADVAFGVMHGLSEGMLYLTMWSAIDDRAPSGSTSVVLTLAAVATFNGVWRTFVWDVWVTPPHNVASWNARKVLFVHLPVLALAVVHLTLYESVALFLAVQVVALVGATVHMRYSSPVPVSGRRSAI